MPYRAQTNDRRLVRKIEPQDPNPRLERVHDEKVRGSRNICPHVEQLNLILGLKNSSVYSQRDMVSFESTQ
jgi:hypothetical protein